MPKRENQLNKAIAILQLLLAETDEENVLKYWEIESMLYDSFGIEAGQRSILRDINQLMDLFNLRERDIDSPNAKDLKFKYALEYDARNDKKGYHIVERPLDYADIEFLFECINSSKSISNKTADELKNKIASFRSIYEKKQLLDKGDIYTIGRNKTDNNKLLFILETIDIAIKNNHKITFNYKNYKFVDGKPQKVDRRVGKKYIISPFKTLMSESNYYVLAVNEKGYLVPYRLDRIDNIEELEEISEGMEEFRKLDLSTFSKEVFNMFLGERVNVQLLCTSDLLDTMIDRFGIKSVKPVDDDKFIVTTDIQISDQFFSWICGFKKRVQIIGPQSIVDKFKSFIKEISSSYK